VPEKIAVRMTLKEKERQELEQIEKNNEKRRSRKEKKLMQFQKMKTMQINGRNNRKDKRLEDYEVDKLEHFYGTKFYNELKKEGKGCKSLISVFDLF